MSIEEDIQKGLVVKEQEENTELYKYRYGDNHFDISGILVKTLLAQDINSYSDKFQVDIHVRVTNPVNGKYGLYRVLVTELEYSPELDTVIEGK